MDLGIKELGITFMVGAFTILGFELLLFQFFNIQLTGFFKGKLGLDGQQSQVSSEPETKDQTMKTAVFVGLAFAIGILAEDLSYKYVDSIQFPIKSLPSVLLPDELVNTLDLPSKYDSRVKTLIKDPRTNPLPQPLAKDLARNGAFSSLDNDHERGIRIEKWILNPAGCQPSDVSTEACPSFGDLKDSILPLYYHAKNQTYAHENYYDEMKKIQSRLEFSRSISMLAFIYLLLGILFIIPLGIRMFRGRKLDGAKQIRRRMYMRIPGVLLILFAIVFFSLWAYERESDEFNKRAFGYFSTMLMAEKTKSQPSNVAVSTASGSVAAKTPQGTAK